MKAPSYFLKLVSVFGLLVVVAWSLPAAAKGNDILQQVIHRGTVRIAVIGGNPPWSTISVNGTPEGYEIDLAKDLAAALQVKPVFLTTDIPGRPAMLESHKADVAIAAYTNTIPRAEAITFTRCYMIIAMQFLVRSDSNIKTIADLNKPNIKIGGTRGGIGPLNAAHLLPKAKIIVFDNIDDEIVALRSGQVDTTTENIFWNMTQMKKYPGKFGVLPGLYSREELAFGLPKGDFDWWKILDNFLEQFNNSGANNTLFKKWFGYDMPKGAQCH